MIRTLLFCLVTLVKLYGVTAQGECTDVRGRLISHGQHYVPGPNTCSLCICDNGLAKYCKAVLCSQPQDCRSFRVGNTCCEFICLDDVVKPAEPSDGNVRVAAGAAAIVVLLTVAFVVYRVRKQKQRRPPHADDQRSLTSIGYISGSMGYVGSACETGLSGWKPGCVPRGEAPPPYDEAVAQSRAEAMSRMNESFQRYPAAMEPMTRTDELCSGHGYVNVPRTMTQMPNPSTCFNAPLLQTVHSNEGREVTSVPHHLLSHNVTVGFPSAIRLTGSLGTISNRGLLSLLQRSPEPERPRHVPGFYPRAVTDLHRTIPRISTAIDTTILDTSMTGFSRPGRAASDVRRSFHRPGEPRHGFTDTGRSMPRNLNLATNSHSEPRIEMERRSRTHSDDTQPSAPVEIKPKVMKPLSQELPIPAPQTLPLTVDKPSCGCSYAGEAPAIEDADDYRSECANCKSASSSRWMLEEGWVEEAADGTQTLQRRAPTPAPPPPATATLPQPVTKPSRAPMGPPSNWDNWFSAIPDSDSESEEE